MSHNHNITSKETQEYMEFWYLFIVHGKNNILDYNQHQLMKRAPTLITGPNLVFLAPIEKGLRIPILKCKIILVRNHMALLQNQPMICTSIYSHHSVDQHCSSMSGQSAHPCCSTLLLITIAHQSMVVCSSTMSILHCWSCLVNLLMYTSLYISSYTITKQVILLCFH